MKYLIYSFLVLIGLQCTNSYNQSDDIKVQQKLEDRRNKFIEENKLACIKILMSEIELDADSILIYLSKRIKYDSLTIPYDSIRPEKPEIQFPAFKKPEKPNIDSLK